MIYRAYNLLLAFVAALAVPYYLIRGHLKGQPWSSIPQRFGDLPPSFHQTAAESIWLHVVSVGEVLSFRQFVKELRRRFPGVPIFVSTTTATGRRMAEEKLARWVDGIFYSPLDLPLTVNRVLRRLRPRLVIVAETEIWPNLYRQAKRFGAGLLVVNGRISDRSMPRYRLFRFFFKRVLAQPDVILAQSNRDRDRFVSCGAPAKKVRVGRNLKYDFQPSDAVLPPALKDFFARLQPEPTVVAGSTREEEELPIVEAFQELAANKERALLVVAPRHPERFEEVAALLDSAQLPFLRRSDLTSARNESFSLPGVLLLDTLGELSSLYACADVVFVGGSLNGWGGHNVLEPALAGKPVIVGPFMQNFRAITDELLAKRALLQIEGSQQLASSLFELANDRQKAGAIGRRGRELAESQRGATERAASEAQRLYDLAVHRLPPSFLDTLIFGLPALLWEAAARLRFAGYERGWFPTRRLRTFTICIGNLTAGGVGKTPMTLWLAERLSTRGHRSGVLLRGYRRVSPEAETVVRPSSSISPLRSGDEAQILLRHFGKLGMDIPVGIGPNRYRVGTQLEKSEAADVLILDDGFQHLQLERDLDLVLVDVTRPLDGGGMLPLGRLREPLAGLKRAAGIILTRTVPGRNYDGLERRLKELSPRAPIFRASSRLVSAVDATTGDETALEDLRSKRALAFCGVGNPASFWRSLETRGFQLVHRMQYHDHHHYSPLDVRNLILAAEQHQAEVLITTEKDFVNLWFAADSVHAKSTNLEATVADLFRPSALYWLRIEVEMENGKEMLDWIEARLSAAAARSARPSVGHEFGASASDRPKFVRNFPS